MENILDYLKKNQTEELSAVDIINNFIDPMYDFFRKEIGENIIVLNNSRMLMRKGSQSEIQKGLEKFEQFKNNWKHYILSIDELKEISRSDKNVLALDELLNKSVSRSLQSKIPQPPKNYLNQIDLNESDIDWIIGKIKDYWGKYSQVYSSARINQLLKVT